MSTRVQSNNQNIVVFKSKILKIFTDGSFNETNRRLGYGIVYPQNESWNLYGIISSCKRPDNNKAELFAIFKALNLAFGMFQITTKTKYKSIILYTDSRESINGIEYYNKTQKYKASYVKTVDKEARALYRNISKIINELRERNKPVSFRFVKSHQKATDFAGTYNRIADKLARDATIKI